MQLSRPLPRGGASANRLPYLHPALSGAVILGAVALALTPVPLALLRGQPPRPVEWQLVLLAAVLLAARWQIQGALAGSALSLGVFAWTAARRPPDSLSILVTVVLLAVLPAVIGGLARALDRVDPATAADLRQRKAEEALVRAGEARLQSLLQNASDIVAVLDPAGVYRYVSPSVEHVLGYQPAELSGSSFFTGVHPDDGPRVLRQHFELLASPLTTPTSEFRYRDRAGTWHMLEVSFTNLQQDPSIRGIVINARDITDRVRYQERVSHLAFHDPLTDLPNRALLLERLEQALAQAGTSGRSVAVLFFDLDRFKVINDSLGHQAGDTLLVEVGRRLRAHQRVGDTVSRLGGDEFALVLDEITGVEAAIQVAERLLEDFRRPVPIGALELVVATSVGIACSSGELSEPAALLQAADIALYRAKAAGRGTYAVFDPSMQAETRTRLALENDLRHALERAELRVLYQPIISLESNKASGVEALVRWQHPERGLLGPKTFIPLAEETGLIVPLGRWILEQACHQAAAWQAVHPLTINVNLSPRQFQHPALVEDVAAILAATQLNPALLQLEITESAMMGDIELAIATLERLRALGVSVAIDDFGTGHASLSNLKRLPVDTLKIDRSFVSELASNTIDGAIVRSVVALAQSLGLVVVGEGIETSSQQSLLQQVGCERGQGYLFSRPVSADAITALLLRQEAEPALQALTHAAPAVAAEQ